MKNSNLLLILWVVLVASIAAVAVWFWKTATPPPDSPPVNVVAPGDQPKAKPKPKEGPRAGGQRPGPTPATQPVVRGTVTDPQGKPAAGVTVRVAHPKVSAPTTPPVIEEIRRINQIVEIADDADFPAVRRMEDWLRGAPAEGARPASPELGSTTTDPDGKFTLTLAWGNAGPFVVSARSDAGSATMNGVLPNTDIALQLSTGGLVNGTVTAQVGSVPIEGARVVFDSGEREWSVVTDGAGAFRIEGMPPGRYVVRAGAAGHTPILDKTLQVARGEPVNLVLPRGTLLRVKTMYQPLDGGTERPLAGVEVVAYEEEARLYVTGKSNDYGIVEFPGMPAGSWLVNGRVDKFASVGLANPQIDGEKELVEEQLDFEDAVQTPLQVVDESGAPVPGVEFYTWDGFEGYDVLRSEKLDGVTDAEGKWTFAFEFDGPRASIFGFKKGWGFVSIYPEDYLEGTPVRVVMRKSMRVHGRVVDDKGNAVADASVRIMIEESGTDNVPDEPVVRLRTDAAGRYDFPYLPAGVIATVEAETEDASSEPGEIDPAGGKTDWEIDLKLDTDFSMQGLGVSGGPAGAGATPLRKTPEPPKVIEPEKDK